MPDRPPIRLFVDDGHPEADDYDTNFDLLQPRNDAQPHLDWTSSRTDRAPTWRRRVLDAACLLGSWLQCALGRLVPFRRKRAERCCRH